MTLKITYSTKIKARLNTFVLINVNKFLKGRSRIGQDMVQSINKHIHHLSNTSEKSTKKHTDFLTYANTANITRSVKIYNTAFLYRKSIH